MRNSWTHFFRRVVATCAVSGATAWSSAMCYANAFDVATNPQYADGWQAGDNGGSGFGPWSFNLTDANPAGTYQAMSYTSPIGTAWTLATHANNSGLANAGRAITGGLLSGQTFSTTIDNPTTYHFYRGFDILFTNGSDNNGAGNNAAALRVSVFNYFASNWHLTDTGSTDTGLDSVATGAAGVRIDLTLTSATAYSLTLTPLNGDPAYTHAGTLAQSISWVDYRLWDGKSAAPGDYNGDIHVNAADYVTWRKDPAGHGGADGYATWRQNFGAEDLANNFEISKMSIVSAGGTSAGSSLAVSGVPEPSSLVSLLAGIVSVCMMGLRRLWRYSRAVGQSPRAT